MKPGASSYTSGASTTHTVYSNGTFTATVKDVAGRTNTCSISVTKVDTEAPSCSMSSDTSNWASSKTVSITKSDSQSSTTVLLPGASSYTNSTSFTAYNTTTYTVTVKDEAGRTNTCSHTTAKIGDLVYGDKYVYGAITKSGAARKHNNALSSGDSYYVYWGFKGYVYINPDTTAVIYEDNSNSGWSDGNNFNELWVNGNGYLRYRNRYNGGTIYTAYSYQKIPKGQWIYLEALSGILYNGTKNNYMYVRVNSGSWYSMRSAEGGSSAKGVYGKYCGWDNYTRIGSGNVAFKGTIYAYGMSGCGTKVTTSINIQNQTTGSKFSVGSNGTWNSANTVQQYSNWVQK